MMEKLGVRSIPSLQFIEADRVLTFKDLYQFKKVMGYGGFGFVIAAKDLQSKKNVALKIVDKDGGDEDMNKHVQMLKHEAEILKDLNHENIVKIYRLDIY